MVPFSVTAAVAGAEPGGGAISVTLPLASTFPVPFGASYAVMTNVSLPGGATTAIVHVRVLGPEVHAGDPAATFPVASTVEPIATVTDCALADTSSRCARALEAADAGGTAIVKATFAPAGVAVGAALAVGTAVGVWVGTGFGLAVREGAGVAVALACGARLAVPLLHAHSSDSVRERASRSFRRSI
jgi:hypothetical protein